MSLIVYKMMIPIVKPLFYLKYRPKVYGKENIPKKGPFLLVSNHKNNMDAPALYSTNRRIVHFMAKDELFKGKMGWAFKGMGLIPVNRREKDHNAIPMAIDYLNKGEVVVIFPEGTFNRTENVVAPFKIGAVKIAHDAKVPIVPVALVGDYKLPKRFIMKYGKPYYIESDDLDKENEKLMKIISEMLTE